jgi:hypothetical protein
MPGLAPLRVRLAAFAVMLAIAVAAITLIDRRAMQRQGELEPSTPAAGPLHN